MKKLSVENLTRAIAEVEVNDGLERAQVIGRGIRGENGVKYAVELIEEHDRTGDQDSILRFNCLMNY